MTERDVKLKNLTILYDKLLNHLEGLSQVSLSVETAKSNLDIIKDMNDKHIETRNFARELLSEDFSKLAPNFLVAFMFKEINPQSILFINLVTDYNERLIEYIENDDERLEGLIKDISEFNHTAKKQFKPLRDTFTKMVKEDETK